MNSTASGNTAQEGGGGVYIDIGLTTTGNSTITNNTAPAGTGAGVASHGDSNTRTEVSSSIIAANSNSPTEAVGKRSAISFQLSAFSYWNLAEG